MAQSPTQPSLSEIVNVRARARTQRGRNEGVVEPTGTLRPLRRSGLGANASTKHLCGHGRRQSLRLLGAFAVVGNVGCGFNPFLKTTQRLGRLATHSRGEPLSRSAGPIAAYRGRGNVAVW